MKLLKGICVTIMITALLSAATLASWYEVHSGADFMEAVKTMGIILVIAFVAFIGYLLAEWTEENRQGAWNVDDRRASKMPHGRQSNMGTDKNIQANLN